MNGCKKFKSRARPLNFSERFQWWKIAYSDSVEYGLHYGGDARIVRVIFARCSDLTDARDWAARRIRAARKELKDYNMEFNNTSQNFPSDNNNKKENQ